MGFAPCSISNEKRDNDRGEFRASKAGRLTLRTLSPRMDIPIHLPSPLQESPEVRALRPQKFPELQKPDLRHLDPGIGLDPPKQIGAPPRGNPVSPSRIPQKSYHPKHGTPKAASPQFSA